VETSGGLLEVSARALSKESLATSCEYFMVQEERIEDPCGGNLPGKMISDNDQDRRRTLMQPSGTGMRWRICRRPWWPTTGRKISMNNLITALENWAARGCVHKGGYGWPLALLLSMEGPQRSGDRDPTILAVPRPGTSARSRSWANVRSPNCAQRSSCWNGRLLSWTPRFGTCGRRRLSSRLRSRRLTGCCVSTSCDRHGSACSGLRQRRARLDST
jgi:hypothetical protein